MLGKLKSLFVVTEESGATEEKQVQNETPVTNQPIHTELGSTTGTKGVFNQKIFDSLQQAVLRSNIEGEDYLEFAEAFNSMAGIPLAEEIKIQTVLATLSTRGLTVQKIYESADYYVKVLENEKSKFDEVSKIQRQGQVEKKNEDIINLDRLMEEKKQQIELLGKEIQKLQEEVLSIKNEIANAEVKIQETTDSFSITFDAIVNQIKRNISMVQKVTQK